MKRVYFIGNERMLIAHDSNRTIPHEILLKHFKYHFNKEIKKATGGIAFHDFIYFHNVFFESLYMLVIMYCKRYITECHKRKPNFSIVNRAEKG